MDECRISGEVEEFLGRCISTVAQLEMLLLLWIAPRRRWSAAQVARELRTSVAGAQQELMGLQEGGLVDRDNGGAYYYAPASDALHTLVVGAAQAYLTRRTAVVRAIHGRPMSPAAADPPSPGQRSPEGTR